MEPVPVEPSGRNGNITTRAKSAGHQAQHIDTLPRLLSDRLGAGVYDRTWLAASHEPNQPTCMTDQRSFQVRRRMFAGGHHDL